MSAPRSRMNDRAQSPYLAATPALTYSTQGACSRLGWLTTLLPLWHLNLMILGGLSMWQKKLEDAPNFPNVMDALTFIQGDSKNCKH
jgi:hypothetical protein